MKIYNYHPVTREYIGEEDARSNPVTIGACLVPAYATSEKPPIPEAGKVRVFDGAWSQVDDNRGKIIWNKDGSGISYAVTALGPIPTGWTDAQMPDAESKHDGQKWVPDEDAIKAKLAAKDEAEKETLIQAKLREIAIEALKIEGKLTTDGMLVNVSVKEKK
jgi:hypothetical protein